MGEFEAIVSAIESTAPGPRVIHASHTLDDTQRMRQQIDTCLGYLETDLQKAKEYWQFVMRSWDEAGCGAEKYVGIYSKALEATGIERGGEL